METNNTVQIKSLISFIESKKELILGTTSGRAELYYFLKYVVLNEKQSITFINTTDPKLKSEELQPNVDDYKMFYWIRNAEKIINIIKNYSIFFLLLSILVLITYFNIYSLFLVLLVIITYFVVQPLELFVNTLARIMRRKVFFKHSHKLLIFYKNDNLIYFNYKDNELFYPILGQKIDLDFSLDEAGNFRLNKEEDVITCKKTIQTLSNLIFEISNHNFCK